MQHLRHYEPDPARLADWLPWAALIAPGVVLHKDRLLQQTVSFRGPDLASSSANELRVASARLNNALKRLGSGWSFFAEAQRHTTQAYCTSAWTCPVGWLIDEERRNQHQAQGTHFDSQYYLTLVWLAPADAVKRTEAFFVEDPSRIDQDAQYEATRDLTFFQRTVQDMIGVMQACFPAVHALSDDETLTYLHSCVSTRRHQLKAPPTPMYLDALLTDEPFQPGEVSVLGDHYLMTASINGFPDETVPGILDALNHLNVEYRWCTRFICLDKADAEAELKKYRRKWFSKRKGFVTLIKETLSGQPSSLIDTDADLNANDANEALQELATDAVSFGYYTATVTVMDQDLTACEEKMNRITKVINQHGFATRLETHNAFQAWLSSLPGHVYANVRRPLLNSINLAHLFPLSAVWSGESCDDNLAEKFQAPYPLMVCDAVGGTPFRLSLNVGDVGHTAVFGPTGSGKSTLLSMLALQWRRYPGARVVFFDKDLSALAATMGVGGELFIPGDSERPVAFQPLAAIDQPKTLQWASEWLALVMDLQKVQLTPSQHAEITSALKSLAGAPKAQRTLSGFAALVQDTDVRAALATYTTGPYATLFDADHEGLTVSDWMLIEMGELMALGDAAVIPALSYIFRSVTSRFGQGAPTLLILDEAWKFMNHPYFLSQFQTWLKTLRKEDVYVVFATQELEDALASPIASSILAACQTKLFLPNPEAGNPATQAAYVQCGLTQSEIETLQIATPKHEYFYRSPKGRRVFELQLGDVALCFAARSGDIERTALDQIAKEHPKEDWPRVMLQDRGLNWAVELLNQFTDQTPPVQPEDSLP